MGTWGVSISSDDTVSDVTGFIVKKIKDGESLDFAVIAAIKMFASLENDPDEAPLLWLAIATVQWKYGNVSENVIDRIRNDIEAENGLERWKENSKLLKNRKEVLNKFLGKITERNPSPSKLPKYVVRKPSHKPGDCLEVKLEDGRYTAALVLKIDDSNIEYGQTLVAGLGYLSSEPPQIEIFKKKNWLILKHGNWNGEKDISWYGAASFRKENKRINIVGNISLGLFLPKHRNLYTSWINLGQQILLVEEFKNKKNA